MENLDSLLPGQEVDKLRREIDMLKRKQGVIDATNETNDKEAMVSLSKSIGSLIRVFKEASEDLKLDTHDAVLVSQKLDKIIERLDKVEVQNEKIAKGIVAIADMVEDVQAGNAQRKAAPQQRMMPSQPPSPMPQMQGMMQSEPQPLPSYNIPPQEEKKRSFSFKI